jgi:hypothetical protein
MTEKVYDVVRAHVSEFPEPINLKQGDRVAVGQEYDGPERWSGWYLCSAPGQKEGWVPAQIIDLEQPGHGVIREDYCARELDTSVGDHLTGSRVLNGWLWARRASDGETGWVPMDTLRARLLPPPEHASSSRSR